MAAPVTPVSQTRVILSTWLDVNLETYTNHACLKVFSTSCPTCLPFAYKGMLRDIESTLSEILRTSGAL